MKKLFAIVFGVMFLFCGACCEKKVATKKDGAVREEPQDPEAKTKAEDKAKLVDEAKESDEAGAKADDKPVIKKAEPKSEEEEEEEEEKKESDPAKPEK